MAIIRSLKIIKKHSFCTNLEMRLKTMTQKHKISSKWSLAFYLKKGEQKIHLKYQLIMFVLTEVVKITMVISIWQLLVCWYEPKISTWYKQKVKKSCRRLIYQNLCPIKKNNFLYKNLLISTLQKQIIFNLIIVWSCLAVIIIISTRKYFKKKKWF